MLKELIDLRSLKEHLNNQHKQRNYIEQDHKQEHNVVHTFRCPVINEEITNGTAINFKRLRNIVPKGEMKSDVKAFQPFTALKIP